MNIEILGSGCKSCKRLYELALEAAALIGDDAHVKYVSGQEGIARILELGLMSAPAMTVNGKVALVGFEPNVAKIKKLILETA